MSKHVQFFRRKTADGNAFFFKQFVGFIGIFNFPLYHPIGKFGIFCT